MMGTGACPARSRACILAWIHPTTARSLLYSSQSTAGSIVWLNQCLSIASCFQIRHCAVRARHGPTPMLAAVLPPLPPSISLVSSSCHHSHPPAGPSAGACLPGMRVRARACVCVRVLVYACGSRARTVRGGVRAERLMRGT
jgi:hypothetical protein